MDKAGISANKNTIAFDQQKPMVTSGMGKDEMVKVAGFIKQVVDNIEDDAALAKI